MLMAYTWQTAGTNMVLFSVGLQALPTDPIEAAKIDGANGCKALSMSSSASETHHHGGDYAGGCQQLQGLRSDLVMTQGGPYRSSKRWS